MPEYYKLPDNWEDRGKMTIIYKPFWCNLPIFNLLPYHVGDRVRFHIHIDKPNPNKGITSHSVYEIFTTGSVNKLFNFDGTDVEVEGSPIYVGGDILYFIGDLYNPDRRVIFTATVVSWDMVRFNWSLAILSAVIGAVIGSVLTLVFTASGSF